MPSEKDDKKRLWLVRSDNVILGPWTAEEVKKAVSSAVISLKDETAEPCSFYRPVQEHPEFQSFAKTVRLSASLTKVITTLTGKTTKSGAGGGGTQDKTLTYAETITDTEATDESALTADFKSVEETKSGGPHRGGEASLSSTETAAAEMESRSRTARQAQKAVKIIWGLCIAAALSLLGWIVYNEIFSASQKAPALLDDDTTGLSAWEAGDETTAFQALQAKQKEGRLSNDEERQALAFLFLARKNTEAAGALVKTLPKTNYPDRLLLQGLLALAENSFLEAKSFFQSARSEAVKQGASADFLETILINSAVTAFLARDFSGFQALLPEESLSKLKRRGFLDYLGVLNGALAALKQEEQETERIFSGAKQKALQILKSGSPEYLQELYVLSAWFHKDDKDKREEFIKRALNQDPYFKAGYRAAAGVYFADWSWLAPFCRDLPLKNSGRFPESGLAALCLIKTGKLQEAETFIGALRRQANQPLKTALIAFHLTEKGETDEAEALLDSLPLSGAPFEQSALILKARIHNLKNERERAIQSLDLLLKRDGGSVSGLGEKAKALFHTGDERYKFYKDQALKRHPYYRELLFLERRANGGGPGAPGEP